MAFGYRYELDSKLDTKNISKEDESQCCIIKMVDDWNLIPNCQDVSKIGIKSTYVTDLTQDSWDGPFYTTAGYDFNQSYRNGNTSYDSTAYDSTNPTASDESDPEQSDNNDLALVDDIERNLTKQVSNDQCQIKIVDQLITDLIKNISVLSLYKYYLDSCDNDPGTLNDFKNKMKETGQIIEQINLTIQTLNHSCLGKDKGVLPHALISKLKQNLNTYNNILSQYQHSVTSSFTDGASTVYPGKTVEQVRALLDEFDKTDYDFTSSRHEYACETEQKEKIIKYLKAKAKDIEYLEESATRLDRIYQELFDVLSKRGEHLSSLEHQILISAGCIDRGKTDIQKAYKYRKSGWRRLAYFATLIIITCILLSLPNIIPYLFNSSRMI